MRITLNLFGKFPIFDLDIDRSDEWVTWEPTYEDDIPADYVDAEIDDDEPSEFQVRQDDSGPTYYACTHCEEPLITVPQRLSDEDEQELRDVHRTVCGAQQEEA